MLPLDFIGGHAFQSSGPNISSMPNPPRWAGSLGVGLQPSLAAKYGQFSTPAVPPQQHIWTRPPPCRRSRVAVVRPSADIDSDDTLASDTDASLTAVSCLSAQHGSKVTDEDAVPPADHSCQQCDPSPGVEAQSVSRQSHAHQVKAAISRTDRAFALHLHAAGQTS